MPHLCINPNGFVLDNWRQTKFLASKWTLFYSILDIIKGFFLGRTLTDTS